MIVSFLSFFMTMCNILVKKKNKKKPCPQESERAAGAAAGVAPPLAGHGEGLEPWRAQGRVEGEGAEAAGWHQDSAREAAAAGEDTPESLMTRGHTHPSLSVEGDALTTPPRLHRVGNGPHLITGATPCWTPRRWTQRWIVSGTDCSTRRTPWGTPWNTTSRWTSWSRPCGSVRTRAR